MKARLLEQKVRVWAHVVAAGIPQPLRPKIHHLVLHVTKACNFRCRHCFVDFGELPRDLTLAELRDVSQTVGRLVWLDIGGGEPFLRVNLAEAIDLFQFDEVNIPTNGWWTDKIAATCQQLAHRHRHKVSIAISLDGTRETHDEIRRKPGSFERALETFKVLRQMPDIRVSFLSTLCHRNAAELPELIETLRELGADYHAVNILRGAPGDPTYAVSMEEVTTFWNALNALYGRHGYGLRKGLSRVPLNFIRLRWDTAIETLRQQRQIVPCLGGTATLIIQPNGDVAPCETLAPVASIRERPLRDILNSAEWNAVVQSIRAKGCHCTHECNLRSSLLLNYAMYPALLRGQ